MPIVRPTEVIAKIDALYPLPAGPWTTPLDEATIPEIRILLKLIQQIPKELLPKDSNRQVFEQAITVIKNALQRANDLGFMLVLSGVPEQKMENPLSILKRMLAWCPDLRPKEVRRRLLELAAEHEKMGSPGFYHDYIAMGSLKNVSLDDIRRHMRICKD